MRILFEERYREEKLLAQIKCLPELKRIQYSRQTHKRQTEAKATKPAKPKPVAVPATPTPTPTIPIPKPMPRLPPLEVVAPPNFTPIRATTTDIGFLNRLRVCEFVLQCILLETFSNRIVEKLLTGKLHVPIKYMKEFSDPCDMPSALAIKHLYLGLFKMIESGVKNAEDKKMIWEAIKTVEKSAAANEKIRNAVVEWLNYMDNKPPPEDEIGLANKLMDWALITPILRNELENHATILKTFKSETTTTLKSMLSSILFLKIN
jgi:hypothetical protein